eukprot:1156959-Pelagomonas_calceolata.AAC.4
MVVLPSASHASSGARQQAWTAVAQESQVAGCAGNIVKPLLQKHVKCCLLTASNMHTFNPALKFIRKENTATG